MDKVSDEDAACTLAQGHPKSAPPDMKRHMEGERTGLPHLTPHSLRYRAAHAAVGTKLPPENVGP